MSPGPSEATQSQLVKEEAETQILELWDGLHWRDLKAHPVPAHGQGHLPVPQAAPGPVQPGLGWFQGWGIPSMPVSQALGVLVSTVDWVKPTFL